MLWNHRAADGPCVANAGMRSGRWSRRPAAGQSLASPRWRDLDGDGISDLVVTTASAAWRVRSEPLAARPAAEATEKELNRYRRAVVAISGKTGRGLWRHAVGTTASDLAARGRCPEPARRAGDAAANPLVSLTSTERNGSGSTRQRGSCATGRSSWGVVPIGPVQHADLDGDGEPEILVLGPGHADGR